MRAFIPGIVLLLAGCASTPPPQAVKDLAPNGTLRAAINVGNAVLAQRDAAGGEPTGVSVDLARELARRLGVPVQLIVYDAAGKVVEAGRAGAWDIAFVALDPARAACRGCACFPAASWSSTRPWQANAAARRAPATCAISSRT
jgi:polar amino acid transport system substrate-binding protein